MRNYSTKKKVGNHEYIDSNSINTLNRQNINFEIRKNDNIEEEFNKEIDTLKIIWDKVGVTNKYRIHFVNQITKLSETDRQNILENEKKSLEKLKELFINLKKEIILREKNINSLKNYNNMIENFISEGNIINTSSNIFKEIISTIVNLRYNAIRIVHSISDINKIILGNLQKWNLHEIKIKYLYDPHYLTSMKEDLLFLKNSILSRFIVMDATDIDPFLTNCSTERFASLPTNKLKVPISDDIMKAISKARHILLQEIVLTNNRCKEIKGKNLSDIYLNIDTDKYGNNDKDLKLFIKKNIIENKNNISYNNKNFHKDKALKCNRKELSIKSYNNNIKNLYLKNKPLYSSINVRKKKIKITNKPNHHLLNNIQSKKIVIERDELASNIQLNNLLKDEIYKNKTLSQENIKLKKENEESKAKYKEIKNINDKLNNKVNGEEERREFEEKDSNILQGKIKELSNQNEELLEKMKKNQENSKLIQEENDKLKEKIKELENELFNEKEENKKSKEEIINKNKIIESKDEEILRLKKDIEELKAKKEIEELKTKKENNNIIDVSINNKEDNNQIDFYKGNITNFVELISDKIQLNNLPDFIKRAFLIDESIYTENYYFKGIFPKLIISKKGEDNINGICSLSYENNENLSENLILRINYIFCLEYPENNFELMINFIKENMKFNKLVVYLLYDKIESKFIANKEANNLFQKKLGFKWLCVVRDEDKDQRYIKLYYTKESLNEEKQNKNNFFLENFSIITLNNEQQINIIKNQRKNFEPNYNKYINQNSIYGLLFENPDLRLEFSNEVKKKEFEEAKQKLWKFNSNEFNYNLLTDEEKQNKKININLENSLYKQMESYNNNLRCDLQKRTISINFETNYSLLIEDIYYNRISTEKIKILKEKKTNSLFFLIPSIDNTVFFYLSQINNELQKLIIDNKNNVYEQFLEFQPTTQKELFNFSISSVRDISYIPQSLNKEQKIIYIPSFIIKTHLGSYNFKEINKNLKIRDSKTNEELFISSIDEYINIEFKPDDDIKNSFSVIPVEDKKTSKIIKDSFIIGIFSNDIINKEKLPLIQFLYVTKENFLTKENYSPSN